MKRKSYLILVVLILIFTSTMGYTESPGGKLYIIPIKGSITRSSYNFLKTEIDRALKKGNVEAFIFDIDTYGGYVDSAIDIKDLIIGLDVETISYVNNKAESAGVLVTIASEKIAMNKTATIGSAETIPNDEKTLSLWRSVLRNTAEYRELDTRIIEGMADKTVVVEGINSGGRLINLTAEESLENGISDLIVRDQDELIGKMGKDDMELVVVNEPMDLKFSKYISNPNVSSFLLTLGFLGIVIELLTAGFGFGITISLLSFGLFFGGNIMAGYGDLTSIIFLITGIGLLIVEAIVPGFGLPGISGIILVVLGIVLMSKSISLSITSVFIVGFLIIIITILTIRRIRKSDRMDNIVLSTQLDRKGKYLSSDSKNEYLDKEGISLTSLRPSGYIKIGDEKLDALSDEGLIKKDRKVKVVRVEGSKIFVRRI